MPHKRAKASARAASSSARGFDLAPTPADTVPSTSKRKRSSASTGASDKKEDKYGGLSKNVWRIVNAEKLRDEHRDRKQKRREVVEVEGGQGRPVEEGHEREGLRIRPGEKLADFNRRVETTMRKEMAAVHKVARRSRKPVKKPSAPAPQDDEEAVEPARPEKTFQPRPTSFGLHLHDVAMEPPSLSLASKKKRDLPVSLAQKRVLEEERAKAVKRYRELKESRLALQTK